MTDPLIERTIGQYEIVSRLGRGGMATVYRARQRTMQRDVAIKIMSPDLAEDPEFVARFEREAQVIANLQHPRILPVHDFGHEGELFYLVMRLIEGESLYHRLLQEPLPLATAARYVSQIAEALDYAHQEGVIHRDLKPNNILIDAWDNLYLMDFGLAKMLSGGPSLTHTGAVLGTPAYMAPEQWRGEAVDARTDIYALGVILYEMLVGHPPFESDTPYTLMYKHINDAPPAPHEQRQDLPAEVEAVVLTALAKEPAARYPSAGAMARALNAAAPGLAEPTPVPVPHPDVALEPPPEGGVAPPEEIPAPPRITPPPPPLPLPGSPRGAPAAPPRAATPPRASRPVSTSDTPERLSEALRQALDVVDHSLEAAVVKAAESAPLFRGADDEGRGAPAADAPALRQVRRLLPEDEPLVGVLDVRGTAEWNTWKGMVIGGLALMVLGGIVNVGLFNLAGLAMWFYLAVQIFRTWRGETGRYYLGFTPRRVLLLPRDAANRPDFNRASSADWRAVERLRLTNRYVLLDMPRDRGRAHLGALVAAHGEGGLGPQADWLPGSPVIDLIQDQGFEVQAT